MGGWAGVAGVSLVSAMISAPLAGQQAQAAGLRMATAFMRMTSSGHDEVRARFAFGSAFAFVCPLLPVAAAAAATAASMAAN